jgi:hypothetical protein
MEVYPAFIALMGILALQLNCYLCVEYFVQRLLMNVAQYDTQVLAQRYIAIGVDYQFTEYTVTAQAQISITPFFIEGYKIVIFICIMDVCRYLFHVVLHVHSQQIRGGVKEVHRAVDTYSDVYVI